MCVRIMETTKVKCTLIRILWMLSTGVAVAAEDVYTIAGDSVTLPCTVVVQYPIWTSPVGTVNFQGSAATNPNLGDLSNKLSWASDNRSLVISNTTFTDEGRYQCIAAGHGAQDVTLHVRAALQPPEISNTETESTGRVSVHGTENASLTLTCISRGGKPRPSVTWHRGSLSSTTLSPTTTTTTTETDSTITVTTRYTFTPGRIDDLVEYFCQADYSTPPTSSVSTSVQLYLNLQPPTPTLTTISTPIIEGQENVQIGQCSTSGFRPSDGISMSWTVDGVNIQGTGNIQNGTGDTFSYTGSLTKSVTRQDNGQVTCTINHGTLFTPLSATGMLNVTYAPLNVTLNGNTTIVANGINEMTLTCTTSTANPPATISWSRNGSLLDNRNPVQETAGDYGGKITSQILELTTTRNADGDVYRCTASNIVNPQSPVMSQQKVLDLKYSSTIAITKTPSDVTECTNRLTLTCTVSSKPVSTIKWYKGQQRLSTTGGNNVGQYSITNVDRTMSGQYRCVAYNGYGGDAQEMVNVMVQYSPDVTVTTRNVTTQDQSMDIVCNPSGVPDQYTFSPWTHQWDINGPILNHPGLGNTRVLRLTNLTYEHSGMYTCRVSNGVNCSKNQDAGSRHVNLVVKAAPVLVPSHANGFIRLTSKVNSRVLFNFTFWSNAENTSVQCYRNINGVRGNSPVGALTLTTVPVMLPIFSSSVTTPGTLATLSLDIQHAGDFGQYVIDTANQVGHAQSLTLGVEAQGPPQLPTLDSMIVLSQVLAVWTPGYHGGLDQTVVIQTSTDRIHWDNNTAVFVGKKPDTKPFVTELSVLAPSTTYYMRLFAYNDKGRTGMFTEVFNFTTNEGTSIPECSQINVGVVAGINIAVLITLIMVGLGYVCFKKQYFKCRQTNNKKEEDLVMTERTNIYEGTNTPDRTEHVYTGLQQQVGESTQRESSNVYQQPAVITQPEHVYTSLN